MTCKKGGGRESGGTDGGNRGAVRETSAAAYPDAQSFCPQAGLQCALRYEARIRDLEAENDAIKNMRDDWEAHARRAEARVKKLEREVASWRRTAEVIEAREREASQ